MGIWTTFTRDSSVSVFRRGLQWSDIAGPNRDPLCAMGTVLLIMGIEWIFFLGISLYLDQVREGDKSDCVMGQMGEDRARPPDPGVLGSGEPFACEIENTPP